MRRPKTQPAINSNDLTGNITPVIPRQKHDSFGYVGRLSEATERNEILKLVPRFVSDSRAHAVSYTHLTLPTNREV